MPFFETENLSLFYREKGTGDLLLILPGNTASSACHDGELDYFSRNYHVVCPDFRGTGKSSRIDSWPKDWWEKCADDVCSLITHLGEKKCFIMGTSGGANVALLFAIKYPELVSGVIADSCAELYSPENLRNEVSERGQKTKDQVDFWNLAHGDDWEQVVEQDNRVLCVLAHQGGDLYKGRLNTIKCPVLFTGSLKDSFLTDIGEQNVHMAKQIKDSRIFLINDGDHPFMWYCPDDFRSVCDDFLKKVKTKD